MAKILNVDKLSAKSDKARELRMNGVAYPVVEMTVDNFLATTKTAIALTKDAEATMDMAVEATIDAILRSVPSLPRAELGGLSLAQLNVIAAFVRGDEIDEAEDAPEGEGEAGK